LPYVIAGDFLKLAIPGQAGTNKNRDREVEKMKRNYVRGFIAASLACSCSLAAYGTELAGPQSSMEAASAGTAVPGTPMESASQSQLPDVARRTDERIEVISGRGVEADEFEIYAPDASFIKLHFSKFHLPPGLVIEVSNPDGTESYRYSKNDLGPRTFDSRSGEDGRRSFSAMSISGDTAIVRVTGKRALLNRFEHRVLVDYYMEGIPADEVFASAVQSDTESAGTPGVPEPTSTCGANERYDAVCWEDSHPNEYDRSRPVAKLLIDGSKICSAWRVGPDNRMFTNNHCVYDQAKLDSTEVWFGYQKLECGGIQSTVPLKLTGNELFASDWFLDYTLFSINDFELVSDFGYLGLDIGDAQVGDGIYIPQHGLGRPKQIAIESDMNISGLCEVDADNETGHVAGADIGYFCDTVGGSSGSPVVGRSSHRAVALHHLGGCYNLAVKMSLIWPEVSEFFGGVVPVGDDESDTDTFPPFASFDFRHHRLLQLGLWRRRRSDRSQRDARICRGRQLLRLSYRRGRGGQYGYGDPGRCGRSAQ
jgi:hypothetical protein